MDALELRSMMNDGKDLVSQVVKICKENEDIKKADHEGKVMALSDMLHITPEEIRITLNQIKFLSGNGWHNAFRESYSGSKIGKIFEQEDDDIEQTAYTNFGKALKRNGFSEINLDKVTYVNGWDILVVSVSDDEDNELDIVFGYDEDNLPFAAPIPDMVDTFDTEKEEVIIDLSTVIPKESSNIMDIVSFEWITKNILYILLSPGKVGYDHTEEEPEVNTEIIGNANENRILLGKRKTRQVVVREKKVCEMSNKMLKALKCKVRECNNKPLKIKRIGVNSAR
jgi:hypothetical protein